MTFPLTKREVWIALMGFAAGILVTVAYVLYFNSWEQSNCAGSGGYWNETEERCIEP